MEISPITPRQPNGAASAEAKTALNSDFQTFIEMLTTQAENQDPLNPMDSAEYASQLASFSSVEQQVLTNDLLTALTTQMGASNLAQLSSWVGMEARSVSPVQFDGAPVELHPSIATLADEAELVVYDESGVEVQRFDISVTGQEIEWAGVGSDGAPLAAGLYRFEVENFAAGESLGTSPVENYQRVTEAQVLNGETVLILDGGQPVMPSEIIGIRG